MDRWDDIADIADIWPVDADGHDMVPRWSEPGIQGAEDARSLSGTTRRSQL